MKNIVISLFGSSIMEGLLGTDRVCERYYMLLHEKLSRRFPDICFSLINGAAGGWSTRELMAELDERVLKYAPDYCLVMFGANNDDLEHPERILAPGEFETLMERFQQKLPHNCQRIGVVLNPVINDRHWVSRSTEPVWKEALRRYGGLNEKLAPEREAARRFYCANGYPVIDLGELMKDAPEKYICQDGIHLSPEGHAFFADTAFKVLELLIEK